MQYWPPGLEKIMMFNMICCYVNTGKYFLVTMYCMRIVILLSTYGIKCKSYEHYKEVDVLYQPASTVCCKMFTHFYNFLTFVNILVINVSTSAQVCFALPYNFNQLPIINEDSRTSSETVEYFPYFDGQYLAVAASLNGGNVLAAFVDTMRQWTATLGQ